MPDEKRQAYLVCALAFAERGKVIWTVEREVHGRIAFAPAGDNGFGYDPVFFLPELNRTMAELSTPEKNVLSARGQALADLRKFLLTL